MTQRTLQLTQHGRSFVIWFIALNSLYTFFSTFEKDSKYFDPKSKPNNPRWDCVKVKYISKSNKIISLPELKVLFSEDELLVVKKGNRLSILPVSNDVAKILLDKIKRNY